jgi:hypothetical protein
MEPHTTGRDVIDHEESRVHNWRVSQLEHLGIPGALAETYADRIDWHQVARLVQRGCPPLLALRIIC